MNNRVQEPRIDGQSEASVESEQQGRHVALLLLLFVGSGCSALIYEIVWLQLLQLVIGSSTISLSVLLGTFMGGMCLGSLALPRLIPRSVHPLRVYAILELAIGVLGVGLLFAIPQISGVYSANVGHGLPSLLLRAAICSICLLPPTVLMGATLPAISRWMQTTRSDISRIGLFYGANIVGAVFGCLLAGFYLLRIYDMPTATYVAAGINLGVALISLALAARVAHRVPQPIESPAMVGLNPTTPKWSIYAVIAMSGFCALGAEVVWTRQLSLLLGASVYTFSIILSVFLVGLGIGSSVGAALSRTAKSPRIALGVCQLAAVAAIAWSSYQLAGSLPYWPIDTSLDHSVWFGFQLDLVRCGWAFLPASVLWGASFPLALAAASEANQDAGKLVGGIYAANTVGAIVGGLGFSLVAVSWVGTQQSNQLLMVAAAGSALLALVPSIRYRLSSSPTPVGSPIRLNSERRLGVTLVVGVLCSLPLVLLVPKTPDGLIGYGRNLPTWYDLPDFLFAGEGINASVAVSEFADGTRNFHVSGKVVASSEPQDMRLQRMLGHIPALLHPDPKTVLIVGCGAGVTAGSFIVHPNIERIVVCEIEPLIPAAATKYFGDQNYHLLDDERVEVVDDDARHYIATTRSRFDIITSDPIHPWVKGAATLYSKEYFELCKSKLNPAGVVAQWVPLYETTPDAVQTEIATFFAAFSRGTIWSNEANGQGYDLVVVGQLGEETIDVDAIQSRLDRKNHVRVAESLREVGFSTAVDLLQTYAGRTSDLGPWVAGAEINRDRNLRLQYMAGLGLNQDEADRIYRSLVAFRRFPEDLICVDGPLGRQLRATFE